MAAESTADSATADAPPPEPKEAKDAPDDAATPPEAEAPTKEEASRALMDAVNVALSFKELGNARFKAGDNRGAVEEYDKGLETLKKAPRAVWKVGPPRLGARRAGVGRHPCDRHASTDAPRPISSTSAGL